MLAFTSFVLLVQFQVNARLHFLCCVKNRRKVAEIEELHKHNHDLLRNILPEHVAHYFLTTDNQSQVISYGSSNAAA